MFSARCEVCFYFNVFTWYEGLHVEKFSIVYLHLHGLLVQQSNIISKIRKHESSSMINFIVHGYIVYYYISKGKSRPICLEETYLQRLLHFKEADPKFFPT